MESGLESKRAVSYIAQMPINSLANTLIPLLESSVRGGITRSGANVDGGLKGYIRCGLVTILGIMVGVAYLDVFWYWCQVKLALQQQSNDVVAINTCELKDPCRCPASLDSLNV